MVSFCVLLFVMVGILLLVGLDLVLLFVFGLVGVTIWLFGLFGCLDLCANHLLLYFKVLLCGFCYLRWLVCLLVAWFALSLFMFCLV